MVYSNAVVTVSPSYAHDIVHAGAGSHLRTLFNQPHVRGAYVSVCACVTMCACGLRPHHGSGAVMVQATALAAGAAAGNTRCMRLSPPLTLPLTLPPHTHTHPQISAKFQGIINGVDITDWNPADDATLPLNYSASFPQGKAVCKEYLQRVRCAGGRWRLRCAGIRAGCGRRAHARAHEPLAAMQARRVCALKHRLSTAGDCAGARAPRVTPLTVLHGAGPGHGR